MHGLKVEGLFDLGVGRYDEVDENERWNEAPEQGIWS